MAPDLNQLSFNTELVALAAAITMSAFLTEISLAVVVEILAPPACSNIFATDVKRSVFRPVKINSLTSREKIRAYDFFRGAHAANGTYQLRTWYTHNIHDGGPEVLLLMRNFAIAFNNEGMKRLGMQ